MLLFFLLVIFNSISYAQQYFPILFQRTVYVDNLSMQGAWWSNPATLADISEQKFLTSNVLPLGDSLLLSTARFFLPLKKYHLVTGFGLLGAGAYKVGTSHTDASNTGVTYTSNFAFSHPRFQFGLAYRNKILGSIGALATLGSDPVSVSYKKTVNKLSPGIYIGWYSPNIFKTIRISASTILLKHETGKVFYEKSLKLGFFISIFDSLILGTGEYTVSLGDGYGILAPKKSFYDASKILISFKINKALAGLIGYSNDSGDYFTNGHLVHLGIEARETNYSPVFGGYEAGIKLGYNWKILHRIWLGLNLNKIKKI